MTSTLFDAAQSSNLQRLAASSMGGLRPGEKVVDLFCGAGGWGEGAKVLGIPIDYAVNHWPVAIDTHRTNNPGTRHHLGDAWRARPRDIVGTHKIGLLLASAACTTHSRARGTAPVSKRVHMLGWCIARWMKEAEPRLVMIENVTEWKDWGPLIPKRDVRGRPMKDAQGRPLMVQDPARKGKHYRALLRYMRRLGYAVEEFICDAPDFGEASRRKRLFIQARRDGQPIVWPERTHGTLERSGRGGAVRTAVSLDAGTRGVGGGTYRRWVDAPADGADTHSDRKAEADRVPDWRREAGGTSEARRPNGQLQNQAGAPEARPHLRPHRSAAECIDWSDLGRSIFDRKQPLKPKTQARIAEGIRRYVIADPAPFILRVTQGEGKGWHVNPIDAPLPTQTGRQDLAVATPLTLRVCQHGSNGACVSPADALMATQTTAQEHAIGVPIMSPAGGAYKTPHPLDEPMPALLTRESFGIGCPIVAPQNSGVFGGRVDQPGPAVTTKGHQALISCVVGGAGGSAYAGKPTSIARSLGTVKCDDRRFLGTAVLMNNTSGHTGGRVDLPGPTITTGGQTCLVTPIATYFRHGGGQHSDLRQPLGAIMSGATHAYLCAPLTAEYYSSGSGKTLRPADQTLGAVTTLDRHAAVNVVLGFCDRMLERGRKVAAWLVEHLGDAVPIDEETGLAYTVIDGVRRFFVDILFRMLKPRELARAMGFPDSYVWPKTQRDTVRLIGNAVSVKTAQALLSACLPRGVIRRRRSA